MSRLYDLIDLHAERGDCTCGKCADAPDVTQQPEGHTVDMIFFKVAAKRALNPEWSEQALAAEFKQAIVEHKGHHNDVDLFDGKEHNYMELGGWIGDQGYALLLMGLGAVLGMWKLLTPRTIVAGLFPDEMVMEMAGAGMVSIQVDSPDLEAVLEEEVF